MISTEAVSRSDQTRALSLSTVAFTVCFAVWTIFSIIGVAIKAELGLNESQFGLLVATPILTGSNPLAIQSHDSPSGLCDTLLG